MIPDGLDVVDRRLVSHGFKLTDGNVIEGTVTDLTTGKPLAAMMQLLDNHVQYRGDREVR